MISLNLNRIKRLIHQSIDKFSLDLSNLIVLTEAATGYYSLTPIIAAKANAEKVFALTRNSKYGKATDIYDSTMYLAQKFNVEEKIDILFERNDPRINSADIITNLGFVRPLNKEFLLQLKKTAVIPLMWETWEYRSEDLDLNQCRSMGIPVLGTNEHDDRLRTIEFVGHIALKMLYNLDIEVFLSKVIILGSGEFGAQIAKTIQSIGANVVLIKSNRLGKIDLKHFKKVIKSADALVIAEHHNRNILIGPQGEINPNILYEYNPSLCIAHICGKVDQLSIEKLGFRILPKNIAPSGFMSAATDYVGPKPLIDLHSAGLRVGQLMSEARNNGLSGFLAEISVLEKVTLAQGFKHFHDIVNEKRNAE